MNRGHTLRCNNYQHPKYINWGMKVSSTEALKEQIETLQKNFRSVSHENVIIKTEKRRLEKLLKSNDRKLKRLLNTVTDKEITSDVDDDDMYSNFIGNETRKYSTTELLDVLNVSHNANISLKKQLEKAHTELITSKDTINHDIQSQQQQVIQNLETQLEDKDDIITKLKGDIKAMRKIIKNEKFFSNKILDEIAQYKIINIDLQSKIKRLSHKLFEIEREVKDRVEDVSEDKASSVSLYEAVREIQSNQYRES